MGVKEASVRRFVLVAVPFALSLLAGSVAAALPPSPAKYATGQHCEDALAEGRMVIGSLPASRAAWSTYMTEVDGALTLITRRP